MKFELMLRSRAREDESVEDKHARFMDHLRKAPSPWGLRPGVEMPPPPQGGEFLAEAGLTRLLGKGLKGSVVYQVRRRFRDEGAHDDHVTLTFDSAKVNYADLVDSVFPGLVHGFQAYRGHVGPEEFLFSDFDFARHIDYRSGVFRFYPVNYFDRALCERAFSLPLSELCVRVTGVCDRTVLEKEGVFIVLSSDPNLTLSEADALNQKTWSRVRGQAESDAGSSRARGHV